MICKCGCGNHLTGKQRKFFSDACRKRHKRNGLNAVRETAKNGDTVDCMSNLGQFPDSGLSENSKLHVVEVLTEAASYEEVWTKRIMNKPECSRPGQLEMHQEAAAFIRNLVDELTTN